MTQQFKYAEDSANVKATTVAEYVVGRLAAEGIEHCLGVAGDYLFPIHRRENSTRGAIALLAGGYSSQTAIS